MPFRVACFYVMLRILMKMDCHLILLRAGFNRIHALLN
jgi:hypothetical protein